MALIMKRKTSISSLQMEARGVGLLTGMITGVNIEDSVVATFGWPTRVHRAIFQSGHSFC